MAGKNIVLLSDGTGNTGGKGRGTNVWKLYRAVEIHDPAQPQVLFYDDGVGTGHFRPIRVFGGAFGYGLTQNIRELYSFLVRNYEPGDRIYLFGFSRGAFTVRALSGLICRCGIIDHRHEEALGSGLDRLVVRATRIYKRTRRSEDRGAADAFRKRYAVRHKRPFGVGCSRRTDVPIKLIGVWDTVDAVGLPVDELTQAFDKIARIGFPDCRLLPCVERGFQALSIDDERLTFHPILWDEAKRRQDQIIEQVWFSGVHANVGGGYLKDQMALVSLDWMMGKAVAAGLRFNSLWDDYRRESSVHAMLHDSRAGWQFYYRYRPRDISELCAQCHVNPRIHGSVFDRIARSTANYAPAFIPEECEIADDATGRAEKVWPPKKKERLDACRRALETARDTIWCRKLLYLAFVWWSLLLLATGHVLSTGRPEPWSCCEAGDQCESSWCLLEPVDALFDLALWAAPPLLEGWVNAFRCHLGWLAVFLAAAIGLMLWRTVLKRRTVDAALAAWRITLGLAATEPERTLYQSAARRIRESCITSWFADFKKRILPWMTLALSLPIVLLLVATWVWELCLAPPLPAARECTDNGAPQALAPGESRTVEELDIRCPRYASSILLEKNALYSLSVETPAGGWLDDDYPAGPEGLNPFDAARLRYFLATPLKRSLGAPWFELTGQVGGYPGSRFRVGSGRPLLRPGRDGRLILYVNDATCYWCLDRWQFYGNNKGAAKVVVERLPGSR